MKILVTGATGRVGANLVKQLLDRGYTVRAFVRKGSKRIGKIESFGTEIFYGDLESYEDCSSSVEGVDYVANIGADMYQQDAVKQFDSNLRSVECFYAGIISRDIKLKRFVHVSSDAIYDKYGTLNRVVREDEKPVMHGLYSFCKWAGEELCAMYYKTHKIPYTVLRYPYLIGAGEIMGQIKGFYLSSMLNAYKNNPEVLKILKQHDDGKEKLVMVYDREGYPYRKHFCDVRDAVSAVICAMEQDSAVGVVANIAGPEPFQADKVIPYASEKLGVPCVKVQLPIPPTHFEFDLTRARKYLKFEPKYGPNEMIDSAIKLQKGEDSGLIPTNIT